MTRSKVTIEDIRAKIAYREFQIQTDGRTTICTLFLTNGFTIRGESSTVRKETFDPIIGEQLAEEDAVDKMWKLEGYLLAEEIHKNSTSAMDIGAAVNAMRSGAKVSRAGWNGKGQFLQMQVPDAGSKMTLPYVYISTVDGNLVPWLASQTDLLAQDWAIVV